MTAVSRTALQTVSTEYRRGLKHMKKSILAFALAGVLAGAAQAEVTNVALHAGITPLGSFGGPQGYGGNQPLADFNTLTDGEFVPESQQWNVGSVFWNSTSSTITMTLPYNSLIGSFIVQADDNDTYRIEYQHDAGWLTAWEVPTKFSYGLVTRQITLDTPILANALRFSATGGDNYYAVTEIQALSPVPEPEEWPMLTLGAGLVAFQVRRKQRRA
jgi:hypothetical protein